MSHFDYKRTTRAEATPTEWLPIGAQIGQLANDWADRDDLVAFVGEGASSATSAAACYVPATAEIEINVERAFGPAATPESIGDLTNRRVQFDWPAVTGAIFHEAMHAKHTRWSLPDAYSTLSYREFDALLLLEEGRIEKLGLAEYPRNAGFMRACVLNLVIGDLQPSDLAGGDSAVAARLCGLVLARVDAGSLKEEDVEAIREAIETKIGSSTVADLRDIWLRAQAHSNWRDVKPLYDLAREWVRVVDQAAIDLGETLPEEMSEADMEALSEFIRDLLDALDEAMEESGIGALGDLGEVDMTERMEAEQQRRAEESREQMTHRKVAEKIFDKNIGESGKSGSVLKERRKPTGAERAAAVTVARMLEKAKYRERDVTEISSEIPPGRLRTRAMVQSAALKSKGVMVRSEPWRRTKRTHVDDPTLTVGVMVDISGSMGFAMKPMATTAWVMSEASRRVQANIGMVYYGNDVFPTLKPGRHLDQVMVYTAPDGTEKFDKAFKAVDGSMNLLHGSGARLLVVVSDGNYGQDEHRAAIKWVRRCLNSGVGVLWFDSDKSGRTTRPILDGTSAQRVVLGGSPEKIATEIGRAAARALESVG